LIVNRYFRKEIFSTLIAVLGVLVLIFASKHFVRYMSDAAAGELPTYLIVKLLSLFTLASMVLMIPFALFIAILITLGRMYKDSEITAMEACGIGIPKIMRSVLLMGVLSALLVATLSLWIAPWSESIQYSLRDQAQAESEFGFVDAGRFHEIRGGTGVFYVEDMSADKRHMKNVFVYLEDQGKSDLFSAASGSMVLDSKTGGRYLVLENGFRYEVLPNDQGYRLHEYKRSGIRIAQQEIVNNGQPLVAWSTKRLLRSNAPQSRAELQWRISMPIACLVLSILAVVLSRTNPRQGRFGKLFVALLVFIVYFYLLMLARSLVKDDEISPQLGMWWVHVVMVLFCYLVYARQVGFKFATRLLSYGT